MGVSHEGEGLEIQLSRYPGTKPAFAIRISMYIQGDELSPRFVVEAFGPGGKFSTGDLQINDGGQCALYLVGLMMGVGMCGSSLRDPVLPDILPQRGLSRAVTFYDLAGEILGSEKTIQPAADAP